MKVVNTNNLPSVVKVVRDGQADYVHIAGRSKVFLAEGTEVDPAWAASNPQIRFDKPIVKAVKEPAK